MDQEFNIFGIFVDLKTYYIDMGILQFLGDSKYKERKNGGNYRIYFDPDEYPVDEELQTESKLTDDVSK